MRLAPIFWLLVTCILPSFAADLPELSVYHTSPGDAAQPWAKAILKLQNSTKKTFYVFGDAITDVRPRIQILKDGKWQTEPSFSCLTGSSFFPLYPKASLLFSVMGPTSSKAVTWRVQANVYRVKDPAAGPIILTSPNIRITKDPDFSHY